MKPLLSILLTIFILAAIFQPPGPPIPVTSLMEPYQDTARPGDDQLALDRFISTVKNGRSDQLRGVYAPGILAFPVVQQPEGDPAYVSSQPETITQFRLAQRYQSVGLLAHDFMAGSSFFNLFPGKEIILVNGDGSLKYYQVAAIQRYQALTPTSPYSKFIDLDSRAQLSAEQLFSQTYGKGGSLVVFQTCIPSANSPSWGRLFVLARPAEGKKPDLVPAQPATGEVAADYSFRREELVSTGS